MSSLTPPTNFPLAITTSSLQSALDVLARHDFSALDLPIDPTDSLWERLEKDFQFTLGQSRSIPVHSPTTCRQIGMYFSSYLIYFFINICRNHSNL